MPGDRTSQLAVFVEHRQGTCIVETGRGYGGVLGARAELIERTVVAGE